MKTQADALFPADVSDQRFPCTVQRKGVPCPRRAQFRLTPSCAHTQEDWPTGQACSEHLAPAVRIASARCRGHIRGNCVTVRPLAA